MLSRRAASALLLIATATLALSACTKPVPRVSVYGNGETVIADASVHCFEGQSIDAEECAVSSIDPPELALQQLDTVGVDVPVSVAENGYVVEVGGRAAGRVQQETWYSVPLSLPDGEETTLRVVALSSPDPSASVTGVWRFTLKSGR